ncbi:MAG: TlpA family protein disulfide reductase [Reichenbachiella sp.]
MKAIFSSEFTLLMLILLANCQQNKTIDVSDKIIVTGQFEDSNHKDPPIIFVTNIFSGYEEVTANITENGNFRFDLESDIPLDVSLVYDPHIPILLYPGDSINMSIHSDGMITFSGDRMIENQNIQAFIKLIEPLKQSYSIFEKKDFNRSQEEFLTALDSLYKQSEKLLVQFINSNKINDTSTATWLTNYVTSIYFSKSKEYIWANPTAVSYKVQEALDTKLPISKVDFINSSAIYTFKYEYLQRIEAEIKDEENGLNYYTLMLNAICNFKKDDLMRQLMFIEMIYPLLRGYDVDVFEVFIEAKDSIVTDPYLRSKLDSKYKEVKSKIAIGQNRKGVFIKDSLKSTKVLLDSILAQNRGKVIYMDVWATWCGPCQQEFKNQDPFKKVLKEKDLQFIYICASSKSKAWKATVEQYDLDGINIYLNDTQFDEFKAHYAFSGFPTYFIFDKQGELDTEDFDWRPSARETLEKINSLL